MDIFDRWLDDLADPKAVALIIARIDRIQLGNFGDHKPVGEGVWELRIDYGPGYRVYYGMCGCRAVLLLCGGVKRRQSADIQRAIAFWDDFNRREPKS